MTQQSWLSGNSTRRILQFMFVVQIILLWEAFEALAYVVVFWSHELDVGPHAWKALSNGSIGILGFWLARTLKRSPQKEGSQPA